MTYLALTTNGSYSDQMYYSGKRTASDYMIGIVDTYYWQPKFIVFTPPEKNFTAYLFYPLILIDQKFWHQPYDAFDSESES